MGKRKNAVQGLSDGAFASPADIAKERRKIARDKLEAGINMSVLDGALLDRYYRSMAITLQDYLDMGFELSSPICQGVIADYREQIDSLQAKIRKKAGLPAKATP